MAETPRIEAIIQELIVNINPKFLNRPQSVDDIPPNQYRIVGRGPERPTYKIPVEDNWRLVLQFDAVESNRIDPARPGAWLDVAAIGLDLQYSKDGTKTVYANQIRGIRGTSLNTSNNPRESQRDLFKLLDRLNWSGTLLYQAVETAKEADFDYFQLIKASSIPIEEVPETHPHSELPIMQRRTRSTQLVKRYDGNAKALGFELNEEKGIYIKNLKQ